jgi:ABC-type bacteriocin/lantibiotic exporter with double-glycine peptidase domain
MVLDYLGEPVAYDRLVTLLGIEEFGAPLGNLRRLTRLGLHVTYGEANFSDLVHQLSLANPCVVAVSTAELPYWGQATDHAVVVVGLDDEAVYVNDPYFDDFPQRVPRDHFMLAWLERDHRLAVITSRP